MSRQPEGPPPPPTVQKLRVRYAKRGRLRFTSHRDFARAFERAIRRAGLPIAYSAGFNPHPKVSYAGAAPTGVASEAEYLEIGLAKECDTAAVRDALDAALPPGLDILEVVDAAASPAKSLNDLIEASFWQIVLPGVPAATIGAAVKALLAVETAPVERPTKDGSRTVDVRAALVSAVVAGDDPAAVASAAADPPDSAKPQMNATCATLNVVVRHSTPAVRPDDILTALRTIGALTTPVTPVVTRLAQGLLDDTSPEDAERLIDPFGPAERLPAHHG
ncbi:MAG TPA: TIGR03936 family radical SAM-associated protein [Caulobacteraceae bacterium]